jgi:predicted SAM-dependent methyltransferase
MFATGVPPPRVPIRDASRYAHENVTFATDSRQKLPFGNHCCKGIHVEHFFEHLNPFDECPKFLSECRRVLQPSGILRIIVPDAEKFIRAYLSPGWEDLKALDPHPEAEQQAFRTKMASLTQVFVQNGEHYCGYDFETLEDVLRENGFAAVNRLKWREGEFPGGPIDREQHRLYSLYVEAAV